MTADSLASALVSAIRSLTDLVWWDGFLRGIVLGALGGLALAAMLGLLAVATVYLILLSRGR